MFEVSKLELRRVKFGQRESVVRCATKSGSLLPGALYRVRGQKCTAAVDGVGAESGWSMESLYLWPRCRYLVPPGQR